MRLSLVIPPAQEPLTIIDVRRHLRIDDDQDDQLTYVAGLIQSARQHFDGMAGILGRALITQRWRLDLDDFLDVLRMPLPPLQSVEKIEYLDIEGTLKTVDPAVYEVVTAGTSHGYVLRRPKQQWPADVDTEIAYPVRITFVAGYGPAGTDVPAPIRHAMLLLVANWYENREATVMGSASTPLPFGVSDMINPYRVHAL